MTTVWRLLVAALLLGLVAGPADAQKRGGTLTIVRPTDPVSLDPQLETTAPGAWVYSNVLESLVAIDEKLQLHPKLASSWEVMSPTRVRFKLRLRQPRRKRDRPRRHHDGAVGRRDRCAAGFDQDQGGLPPADQLDVDLGEKLGIQQRAMLGATRIID